MRQLAVRQKKGLVVRKRKRHPNRSLTEDQIRSLLASIENIEDDALIRLGLSVGLRVSEVVSIRTSEIDFERGLIKIWDEKKDKWRFVMPTEKLAHPSRMRRNLTALVQQAAHYWDTLPVSDRDFDRAKSEFQRLRSS